MYEACQVAREHGMIFSDEFLRWCFSEGLYTPFQVLLDFAKFLYLLAGLIAILGFYAAIFILKPRKV